MSLATDFNKLTPEQEAAVLRWIVRRLCSCLELDVLHACQELAQFIWEQYKAEDAHFNHSATAEEVLETRDRFSERRIELMIQRIVEKMMLTQTVSQVEDPLDQAGLIEMTVKHVRYEIVFAVVEAITDT